MSEDVKYQARLFCEACGLIEGTPFSDESQANIELNSLKDAHQSGDCRITIGSADVTVIYPDHGKDDDDFHEI